MSATVILVADDDPDSRAIARLALEHRGFEVFTAVNGRDAIEAARDRQPDLILMDLQMPALSGFEAVRALKADDSTAGIPVIAVTAASLGDDIRDHGFCAILQKPIAPTDLTTAVEHCCEEGVGDRDWIDLGQVAPNPRPSPPPSDGRRTLAIPPAPLHTFSPPRPRSTDHGLLRPAPAADSDSAPAHSTGPRARG